MQKEVLIHDGETQILSSSRMATVREVLAQNGIVVADGDVVSPSPDSKLRGLKTNEITIKRAVPVKVAVGGQTYTIMTAEETVGKALESRNILNTQTDKLIDAQPDDKIVKDMQIKILRTEEKLVTENSAIPFNVITKENNRMEQGTEKVLVDGQVGSQEKQFKVVIQDGKEIAKQIIKEVILSNPVDKIIEVGTILSYKPTRGDAFRYTKVLDMKATAYSATYEDTGKSPDHPAFGITATGIRAYQGVIAVDPRVIPLGTKVYVEIAGSIPDYGYAIAADTGGAIKGNIIDLYYDDYSFAKRFGYQRVKVYVLSN